MLFSFGFYVKLRVRTIDVIHKNCSKRLIGGGAEIWCKDQTIQTILLYHRHGLQICLETNFLDIG